MSSLLFLYFALEEGTFNSTILSITLHRGIMILNRQKITNRSFSAYLKVRGFFKPRNITNRPFFFFNMHLKLGRDLLRSIKTRKMVSKLSSTPLLSHRLVVIVVYFYPERVHRFGALILAVSAGYFEGVRGNFA